MNMEKKNYSTIMFTKDEHKDEVLSILNDERVQALMPENIRGKAGKMVLWLARYIKIRSELGFMDFDQNTFTPERVAPDYNVNKVGALYFRMQKNYEEWVEDANRIEVIIKKIAEDCGLSSEIHPIRFDKRFENGQMGLYVEFDCQDFDFHALNTFISSLDQGCGLNFHISIKYDRVLLTWNVSEAQAFVQALDRYRDIFEIEIPDDNDCPPEEEEFEFEGIPVPEYPIDSGEGAQDEDIFDLFDGGDTEEAAEVPEPVKKNDGGTSSDEYKKKRAKPVKFPKSKEGKVIKDYQSGMSLSRISQKWGISSNVISRILRNHNIKRNRLIKFKNLRKSRIV